MRAPSCQRRPSVALYRLRKVMAPHGAHHTVPEKAPTESAADHGTTVFRVAVRTQPPR